MPKIVKCPLCDGTGNILGTISPDDMARYATPILVAGRIQHDMLVEIEYKQLKRHAELGAALCKALLTEGSYLPEDIAPIIRKMKGWPGKKTWRAIADALETNKIC